MKKHFLVVAAAVLFVMNCPTTFAADADTAALAKRPHMEFNDCQGDNIAAILDAKTGTLLVTIQPHWSKNKLTVTDYRYLDLSWYYDPKTVPANDSALALGWMRNHRMHSNSADNAWAEIGWDDQQVHGSAGIVTKPSAIIRKLEEKGKILLTIKLDAGQIEMLRKAQAADAIILPRLWFKN